MDGKWIRFDLQPRQPQKKTDTYKVVNKQSNSEIGEVKWYGPFRQYSFFPDNNTVYERQCLMDIAKFLNKLMVERKQMQQLLKGELL